MCHGWGLGLFIVTLEGEDVVLTKIEEDERDVSNTTRVVIGIDASLTRSTTE